jgi:hypothetical protein
MNIAALVLLMIDIFVCLLTIHSCIKTFRALRSGKRIESRNSFPSIGLVIILIVSLHLLPLLLQIQH